MCSGVVLHAFTSERQDIPTGSHPSTAANTADSRPQTINSDWIEALVSKCAPTGLSVNFWGISGFDSEVLDLAAWLPLVRETGGKIYRSVMGSFPKDERIILTEKLKRATIPQLATKCLFRIRTSPSIIIGENTATGNMSPDQNLPGLYHMAACGLDSAYTFSLGLRPSAHNVNAYNNPESDKRQGVCVQFAFQYTTLVEANDSDVNYLFDASFFKFIKLYIFTYI